MAQALKINLLVWAAAMSFGLAAAGLKSEAITAGDLQAALNGQTPPLVVDIRSPDEYSSGHVPHAKSIPLPLLPKHLPELSAANDLVLYCNDSRLTRMAERLLMRKKIKEFRHLSGGLRAWTEAELPLETSLE